MATPRVADTLTTVEECIADLSSSSTIAVDVEGIDLSRVGKVSLVQLKADHSSTIWLLDVTVLGKAAFNHANADEVTIKDILERPSIKKIFYDVRADADALYNIYDIDMHGVTDLQIVDLAYRLSNQRPHKHLNGLTRSIEWYLKPGQSWSQVKEAGIALFAPDKGGSFEVWEERPLRPILVAYAAQDVAHLSTMEAMLLGSMGRARANRSSSWASRIQAETDRRLAQAKMSVMEAHGSHRALAPVI